MNKKKKEILIIAGSSVIVLFAAGTMIFEVFKGPDSDATPLAACLKEKNITMYGAYWCPHCQNQKKMFGDAFSLVPYVECTQNVDACTKAKVEGYPTWIFPDGKVHAGEYSSLEDLAKESDCPVPIKK